jgi:phosphatidylglycerophosphate synthase
MRSVPATASGGATGPATLVAIFIAAFALRGLDGNVARTGNRT